MENRNYSERPIHTPSTFKPQTYNMYDGRLRDRGTPPQNRFDYRQYNTRKPRGRGRGSYSRYLRSCAQPSVFRPTLSREPSPCNLSLKEAARPKSCLPLHFGRPDLQTAKDIAEDLKQRPTTIGNVEVMPTEISESSNSSIELSDSVLKSKTDKISETKEDSYFDKLYKSRSGEGIINVNALNKTSTFLKQDRCGVTPDSTSKGYQRRKSIDERIKSASLLSVVSDDTGGACDLESTQLSNRVNIDNFYDPTMPKLKPVLPLKPFPSKYVSNSELKSPESAILHVYLQPDVQDLHKIEDEDLRHDVVKTKYSESKPKIEDEDLRLEIVKTKYSESKPSSDAKTKSVSKSTEVQPAKCARRRDSKPERRSSQNKPSELEAAKKSKDERSTKRASEHTKVVPNKKDKKDSSVDPKRRSSAEKKETKHSKHASKKSSDAESSSASRKKTVEKKPKQWRPRRRNLIMDSDSDGDIKEQIDMKEKIGTFIKVNKLRFGSDRRDERKRKSAEEESDESLKKSAKGDDTKKGRYDDKLQRNLSIIIEKIDNNNLRHHLNEAGLETPKRAISTDDLLSTLTGEQNVNLSEVLITSLQGNESTEEQRELELLLEDDSNDAPGDVDENRLLYEDNELLEESCVMEEVECQSAIVDLNSVPECKESATEDLPGQPERKECATEDLLDEPELKESATENLPGEPERKESATEDVPGEPECKESATENSLSVGNSSPSEIKDFKSPANKRSSPSEDEDRRSSPCKDESKRSLQSKDEASVVEYLPNGDVEKESVTPYKILDAIIHEDNESIRIDKDQKPTKEEVEESSVSKLVPSKESAIQGSPSKDENEKSLLTDTTSKDELGCNPNETTQPEDISPAVATTEEVTSSSELLGKQEDKTSSLTEAELWQYFCGDKTTIKICSYRDFHRIFYPLFSTVHGCTQAHGNRKMNSVLPQEDFAFADINRNLVMLECFLNSVDISDFKFDKFLQKLIDSEKCDYRYTMVGMMVLLGQLRNIHSSFGKLFEKSLIERCGDITRVNRTVYDQAVKILVSVDPKLGSNLENILRDNVKIEIKEEQGGNAFVISDDEDDDCYIVGAIKKEVKKEEIEKKSASPEPTKVQEKYVTLVPTESLMEPTYVQSTTAGEAAETPVTSTQTEESETYNAQSADYDERSSWLFPQNVVDPVCNVETRQPEINQLRYPSYEQPTTTGSVSVMESIIRQYGNNYFPPTQQQEVVDEYNYRMSTLYPAVRGCNTMPMPMPNNQSPVRLSPQFPPLQELPGNHQARQNKRTEPKTGYQKPPPQYPQEVMQYPHIRTSYQPERCVPGPSSTYAPTRFPYNHSGGQASWRSPYPTPQQYGQNYAQPVAPPVTRTLLPQSNLLGIPQQNGQNLTRLPEQNNVQTLVGQNSQRLPQKNIPKHTFPAGQNLPHSTVQLAQPLGQNSQRLPQQNIAQHSFPAAQISPCVSQQSAVQLAQPLGQNSQRLPQQNITQHSFPAAQISPCVSQQSSVQHAQAQRPPRQNITQHTLPAAQTSPRASQQSSVQHAQAQRPPQQNTFLAGQVSPRASQQNNVQHAQPSQRLPQHNIFPARQHSPLVSQQNSVQHAQPSQRLPQHNITQHTFPAGQHSSRVPQQNVQPVAQNTQNITQHQHTFPVGQPSPHVPQQTNPQYAQNTTHIQHQQALPVGQILPRNQYAQSVGQNSTCVRTQVSQPVVQHSPHVMSTITQHLTRAYQQQQQPVPKQSPLASHRNKKKDAQNYQQSQQQSTSSSSEATDDGSPQFNNARFHYPQQPLTITPVNYFAINPTPNQAPVITQPAHIGNLDVTQLAISPPNITIQPITSQSPSSDSGKKKRSKKQSRKADGKSKNNEDQLAKSPQYNNLSMPTLTHEQLKPTEVPHSISSVVATNNISDRVTELHIPDSDEHIARLMENFVAGPVHTQETSQAITSIKDLILSNGSGETAREVGGWWDKFQKDLDYHNDNPSESSVNSVEVPGMIKLLNSSSEPEKKGRTRKRTLPVRYSPPESNEGPRPMGVVELERQVQLQMAGYINERAVTEIQRAVSSDSGCCVSPAGSPKTCEDVDATDSGKAFDTTKENKVPYTRNVECICGRIADLLCECRTAIYCSVACQQEDWTSHKEVCESWRDPDFDENMYVVK